VEQASIDVTPAEIVREVREEAPIGFSGAVKAVAAYARVAKTREAATICTDVTAAKETDEVRPGLPSPRLPIQSTVQQNEVPATTVEVHAVDEPLGWTQVMGDPTLGDGLDDIVEEGVPHERSLRIIDGINRLLPPFHLENLSQIYPDDSGRVRAHVIETTHIVGNVPPNLFPLCAPVVAPTVQEIHLSDKSESDCTNLVDRDLSQAGVSDSWRELTLADILRVRKEGNTQGSVIFHESLIKTLRRRPRPERPPYTMMIDSGRICTSKWPNWSREPSLCYEAEGHSPAIVLHRSEFLVELLKHRYDNGYYISCDDIPHLYFNGLMSISSSLADRWTRSWKMCRPI